MMKLFKIAFLPLLAGILLLPAASRPVRAAGSAAVEAGAGDRKRDKKKKQEADTAAKATPYEKLFKDKRVETVRGGGLTLHLTADKLYLELPDSLLGRGLMITTTIEWTGDPGDGLAHQQPVPPYMVEFGRGKSDTLLCMREFAPVVIVDGSPAMRGAPRRHRAAAGLRLSAPELLRPAQHRGRGLCRAAQTACDAPHEERFGDGRSAPALRVVAAQHRESVEKINLPDHDETV